MPEPWVWSLRFPWRTKWQLALIFLPGKSMDRGAWRATVHRVAKSQTQLIRLNSIDNKTCREAHIYIHMCMCMHTSCISSTVFAQRISLSSYYTSGTTAFHMPSSQWLSCLKHWEGALWIGLFCAAGKEREVRNWRVRGYACPVSHQLLFLNPIVRKDRCVSRGVFYIGLCMTSGHNKWVGLLEMKICTSVEEGHFSHLCTEHRLLWPLEGWQLWGHQERAPWQAWLSFQWCVTAARHQ